MGDLRNLQFIIGYDISDKPIKQADAAVDQLKASTMGAEQEQKMLGETTEQTGKKATTAGRRGKESADKTKKAYGSLNTTLLGVASTIGVLFGFHEIKQGMTAIIGMGAQLEEESSKFSVVFGELEDAALSWTAEYADAVGRSVDETRRFMADNQNLLVGFGASRAEAFKMSKQIQTLGVDLASFNNEADEDVLQRMQSGLLGNHLAVKSLGIALTETTLAQETLRLGYTQAFSDLDPLVKMQIRYNVMLAQSQDAIGDAERTSGSYTNQLKRMKAEFSDSFARIGRDVLPELTELIMVINENKDGIVEFVKVGVDVAVVAMKAFGEVVAFVSDNSEILIPLLGAMTTAFIGFKIVGGVTALLAGLDAMLIATTGSTLATLGPLAAFNALLTANPIGLVIIGISALVAAGIALWRNWDVVVEKIGQAWDWLKEKWEGVKDIFTFGDGDYEVNANIVGGRTHQATTPISQKPAGRGKFANGTNNAPRGLAMINEFGDEMVQLNAGDKVFTAHQTKQFLQGNNNSAQPIFEIKIMGGSDSAETIAKKVREEVLKIMAEMGTKEGLSWQP